MAVAADTLIVQLDGEEPKPRPTPLPRGPILSISVVMLTNSLSQSILYPFAAVMVDSFNVTSDAAKLGYYTGFLASAAFLGSLITNPFWGAMSDRYGRKNVLLIGLMGNLLCSLLFGSSKTYHMAITARFINGLFTTIIATGRSYVAELCDSTNQAQGFAMIGTCTGLGLIIGPALGGFLCLPAQKYPWLFPKGSLFDQYPFLLPCLSLSILCSFSFLASLFYLPETLGWATASTEQEISNENEKNEKNHSNSLNQIKDDNLSCCDEIQLGEKAIDVDFNVDFNRNVSTVNEFKHYESLLSSNKENIEWSIVNKNDHDDGGHGYGDDSSINALMNSMLDKQYGVHQSLLESYDSSKRKKGKVNEIVKKLKKWLSRLKMNEGLKDTLKEKDLMVSMIFYGVLSFCTSTFNEVFPLWCITPWNLGGLGIGTDSIAIAQTACGAVLIPLQQFVYAPLVNKVGAVAALRSATFVGLVLISFPLVRLFGHGSVLVIVSTCILMAIRSFPQCVYTSVYILMSNGVRDPAFLGSVNGISQSINMVFRAVAPTLGGSLFAWSTGLRLHYPFDANMWFLWLGFLYVVMLGLTYMWSPQIDQRKFVMSTRHPQYEMSKEKNGNS